MLGDFDDAVFEHGGRRHPVQPPRRRLRDRDRGRRRGAAGLRGRGRRRGRAAAAVSVVARARPDAGLRRRLGRRAAAAGTTSIPTRSPPPGDGLHWTGPYKSWEARCAECHATGYTPQLRPRDARPMRRSGRDRRRLRGLPRAGRGACSPGPRRRRLLTPARWPGLTAHGLTVDLAASAEAEIEQCAGCHSRREAFGDGNPLPGTPYHDSYALALLRDGLYHADGRSRRRTTSTARSCRRRCTRAACAAATATSRIASTLRAEGNAVCTQCHSPPATSASRRCGRRSTTIRRTTSTRRDRRARSAGTAT